MTFRDIASFQVRISLVVILLLVPLAFLLGADDSVAEGQNVRKCVEILLSEDINTVNEGIDGILDDRKQLIEQLIPIIDPVNAAKHSDRTRSAAAFLLGQLRAAEAVPVLSASLANPPGNPWSIDMDRLNGSVVIALVNIGRPAVPKMIENIEKSDENMVWHKSLYVMSAVLGGKRRTLELLSKLEERAVHDDIKAARIGRAAKYVQEHWTEKEEPLY